MGLDGRWEGEKTWVSGLGKSTKGRRGIGKLVFLDLVIDVSVRKGGFGFLVVGMVGVVGEVGVLLIVAEQGLCYPRTQYRYCIHVLSRVGPPLPLAGTMPF